ncbi:MAG: cupin domain-containing protein [Rhodanobacter thiooxydans]|uniref:cupin domain-containing protein n=1 Tax=Burkholderia sp. LMG 13014 TaxID=2709306 RepID=UPI0019634A4C|nr:cupin domain-containing protein [Burkholderia sp. LMG 13014]MCW0203710.1 cupin domain-containing protein [Rhodanobacter thiooxydans]
MRINADFSRRAIVTPSQHQWVASPQGGVERVMLDRVGAEKARATSIVRYAPDSWFPHHPHPGGEEILVLSGTFSEGDAHFPAGWYLRNPPGSSHQPSSGEGALIFVKLWQMQPDDRQSVRIDTLDPAAWSHQDGRQVCRLFSSAAEQVSLQRLAAHEVLPADPDGGTELLVLSGEMMVDDQRCDSRSWIRLPVGDRAQISAGEHGATVYLKTGHLAAAAVEV